MSKPVVLVTGGTGYIGSHTVVELIRDGYEVVIADNLSTSYPEVVNSITAITGIAPSFTKIELCDREAVFSFFRKHKIDAVVHFAAKKLVGESVENPLLYYYNNLTSLVNISAACVEAGVKNIVFSSSCTVYGQPDVLPVDENATLKKAESPYGNTKKISEDILQDLVKAQPMNVISLRYFNPVGAHESALIGEYPAGTPANLMPILTQTAAGVRPFFNVFGNDYNTPDGSCIRDYIHVCDVADAHVIALKRMLQGKMNGQFEVFNLGTGKGVSVFEIIKTFESVNNLKLNFHVVARRPGDVEKVWAATEKANKVLGWKANRSLEQMVSSAWAWQQKLAAEKNIINPA